MKTTYVSLLRDSSARSFSLRLTAVDALSVLFFCIAAGCAAFFLGTETLVPWRLAAAAQAAVGASSCYVIVRSLVPLALSLSFADMMRLKTSYYLWTTCLVGLACLGPETRTTFASFNAVSLSLALTLASVALTVRFLQVGSFLSLTFAFACAGLALGVSAFGVVAAVGSMTVLKVVSVRLFGDGDSPWSDSLAPGMVDYFSNPLVRSRMNWLLTLCFVACAALSFCVARIVDAPDVAARLRVPWDFGANLDGAAFLLATAVLPFIVAVSKAREASDVFERLGCGRMLGYLTVAAASAVLLLCPSLILDLIGLPLRVKPNVVVLANVLYAYNLLLATTCILIDIRCRNYRNVTGVRVTSLRGIVQTVYALACAAPLVLLALVVANILFRT